MVAVMLSGEQKDTMKKQIKELALLWHPDKFFPRFGPKICPEDRQKITDGVLDVSKQLTLVLEKERD